MNTKQTNKTSLIAYMSLWVMKWQSTAFAVAALVLVATGGSITNALLCMVVSVLMGIDNMRQPLVVVRNVAASQHEYDVVAEQMRQKFSGTGEQS